MDGSELLSPLPQAEFLTRLGSYLAKGLSLQELKSELDMSLICSCDASNLLNSSFRCRS